MITQLGFVGFLGQGMALGDGRSRRLRLLGLSIVVPLLVSACASLPSSGPTARELVGKGPDAPGYQIVNLNAPGPVLADVSSIATSKFSALNQTPSAAQADEIFPGDVLEITVFEVGASLFSGSRSTSEPGGSGAPTANGQTLPRLRVAEDGAITLPYLGRMQAGGLTAAQLQGVIEAALRGRSQSPQVVVVIGESVGDSVIVMGDVKSPGRRPLTAAHERILDMIALAGGVAGGPSDAMVRLTRGDATAEMPLESLGANSSDNVRLRPQDRLELMVRPRTFTAFGASGKVSEVPFQVSEVTLAEAVARVGGPLDQQADPTAVFVFRASREAGGRSVIYRLNLADVNGYFAAQKFLMRDKDLIYIANARSNAWSKFLAILSSVTTPIVTSKQLAK